MNVPNQRRAELKRELIRLIFLPGGLPIMGFNLWTNMIQKTLSGNPSSPVPRGNGVSVCVHAFICRHLHSLNRNYHL